MGIQQVHQGTELSGRYRIDRLLAHGGMASVYEATDLQLHRQVAIKILSPNLGSDQDFKAKFQAEARVAASLNHPNLVNIYDQGQDGENLFLVLELVLGTTLRRVLDDFKVIDSERAIELVQAVLEGLDSAHRAGIIHRDIKPENILLSNEGRIKLSDFGLARNVSNRTEASEVLGTVGYMAPELVTGGSATPATDIYAIGIMLFEMLTGTRPYSGEANVQIAYQHANSRVPAPSTVNPEISTFLDQIVLKATEPNPPNRFQTAAEMLSAIRRQSSVVDSNATRVLTSEDLIDSQKTQLISPLEPQGEEPPFARLSGSKKFRAVAVFSVLAVLLGGLVGWWFSAGPGALSPVPQLTGRTVTQADTAMKPLDVKLSIKHENSANVAAGLITRTEPAAGGYIAHGAPMVLYVSDGPKLVAVPTLIGKNLADATATLVQAGFQLGEVQSFFNVEPLGNIYENTGSDSIPLPLGTKIDLKVSLGSIPVVEGLSLTEAKSALQLVGLSIGKTTEAFSDTVAKGDIISVAPNQVDLGKGSTIDVIVSKGSNQIVLPNLVGQRILAAQDTLKNLGIKVVVDTNLLTSQWGLKSVKSTNPVAGTTVRIGDTVTLIAHY